MNAEKRLALLITRHAWAKAVVRSENTAIKTLDSGSLNKPGSAGNSTMQFVPLCNLETAGLSLSRDLFELAIGEASFAFHRKAAAIAAEAALDGVYVVRTSLPKKPSTTPRPSAPIKASPGSSARSGP